MNSRNAAFAGAALLIIGLFTPIVTLPIVGSINLFGNGTNFVALDVLVIAIIAAALAAKGNLRLIIWPGIAACGLVLYEFGSLQFRLTQMRESVSKELEGNPFAGIAQGAMSAVQVQWGWLVLAAGAALLLYAGWSSATDDEPRRFQLEDGLSRGVATVCALLLIFAPTWDLLNRAKSPPKVADNSTNTSPTITGGEPDTSTNTVEAPSAEEAAYIQQNLRLYDLKSKYYDSMLDGRVAGVDFKIQNNGNRTLNKVTVRVVFYDAKGNPISEEEYNPVIVSDLSMDESGPLRPHYIWQQESDKFYEAKNVPSEWAEGKATATITDIEFNPNG
jgi:hypothetical protein